MPDTEIGLKASRYQCYQSRDRYLECCDKYEARSDSKCKKLKEKFEQDCPASWVTHFIRKHNYEKYKQKLVDQGILLTDLDNAEKANNNAKYTFHLSFNAFASTTAAGGMDSISKLNGPVKFPKTNIEKLAQCGCMNDILHETSIEQFCERMKVFGGVKYLDTLRTLRDVRYHKTSRLLMKHLFSTLPLLPPYIVLEMAEILASMYMEGLAETDDEEFLKKLLSAATKMPYFLKPTISLLLKSCYPIFVIPELPSNLMSRPAIITALLGNYIRYGRMNLFEALLTKEAEYDLTADEQILRVLAAHKNSHVIASLAYLQNFIRHNIILSADKVQHFNAIVRQSQFWDVSNASFSASGKCSICGEKFKKNEDLSEGEFNTLRDEIMKYMAKDMKIFSSATEHEISNLKKHIKQKMKLSLKSEFSSLVVDTLNVLYTGLYSGKVGIGMDEILEKSLKIFENVLLIVRKGGDTIRIWNQRDQYNDSRLSAFFCHRMSSDDLFILLAVMELGPNTYFMTNDFFVNHRGMLSSFGQSLFDKWVDRRAVRLHGRDMIMPSKFAPYVQETRYGFHIPVKAVDKSVTSYSYLCIQRKVDGIDNRNECLS